MGTFERNSVGLKTRDDLGGNFNKKLLDSHNRNQQAWRSKRGSKTYEELTELQLPMTQRDSIMENFKTDDDIRREKLKSEKQSNNNDDDDDDEKSQ